MKTQKLLNASLILLVISAIVYTGCEGPAGPPGPKGDTGDLSYFEGFAPGIKCNGCHDASRDSTYNVAGRVYQWQQSKHAVGGDIERNGLSCAGCHTTEGFIQRMAGKPVTDQLHPSPPGCFACHSPHAKGDFSLRNASPVTITSNITGVPNATFDYGKGNLCVQCHQTRSMSPKMDGNAPGDSLIITTSRWYSHYGVQGQMILGDGGFKFPGYTYSGNGYHSSAQLIKQEGCITCHMAEPVYPASSGTGKAGGHTWWIGYEYNGQQLAVLTGCKTAGCHPTITTVDYKGVQTAVKANLDTLKQLLGQRGWIETNTASSSYGLVKLTGGKLVIKPAIKAGALYNFFFVEHDLSEGVHNPPYALDLLRSSIAELRK